MATVLEAFQAYDKKIKTQLAPKTGDAGVTSAIESMQNTGATISVSATTPNENKVATNCIITVPNGAADKAWTKVFNLQSGTITVTLQGNWKWVNRETPSIAVPSLLVLHWGGTFGIAQLNKQVS